MRQVGKKYLRPFIGSAAILAIIIVPVACQSSSKKTDAKDDAATPVADKPADVERETMKVDVSGAQSSRSGDTITIDYPVLEDKNLAIPDWVINPSIGGVLGSVGVSATKGLGTREQLEEARLSGRLELASMLENRIQSVGRGELEENVETSGDGRAEESRKNTLGVDRDILDSVVAGSRQRALWFDPENGELYVWMVFDGGVLTKVDHYVTDEVSIFVANTPISKEYMPVRKKRAPPKVIVEAAPAPAPAAPKPKKPLEELEGTLKPLDTIPLKTDGEK